MGPYYHRYIMGPAPIAMAEDKLVFHWIFFTSGVTWEPTYNNLVTVGPSYTLGIPSGLSCLQKL